MNKRKLTWGLRLCAVVMILAGAEVARAAIAVSSLFGDDMVLQRDATVPIFGTATPGEAISVNFNGQTVSSIADQQGHWRAELTPMRENATGQNLLIAGSNRIAIANVVVGDVWLCSGQSNMAFVLGSANRPSDVASANFPNIRQFTVHEATAASPAEAMQGKWSTCLPATARGFSAVGFYFARTVYLDQQAKVPIGILLSSVGGTSIDPWLAPEGGINIPVIRPIYAQKVLPWGPFSLFNGMIYPLAPYAIRGVLWYQGENPETTRQSPDSYFLKMKALITGWRALWESPDLPFYFVQLANWTAPPKGPTPNDGAGYAQTRLMQLKALAIPHTGMAVAIDVGEEVDIHPKDKLAVGERLARWALKNEYGHSDLLPSGPLLKDAVVKAGQVVCSFDYVGSGLMVGAKRPYEVATESAGGKLERFAIAGEDGVWHWADASIDGTTVVIASSAVSAPVSVCYAQWMNPSGCNLYNKEGLPASPFYVEDLRQHWNISASASAGGTVASHDVLPRLGGFVAGYSITPEAGFHVQDVKVDGVSVGAVGSYVFDPLEADHKIEATFAREEPRYEIRSNANEFGTISPMGSKLLAQGGTITFDMTPKPDCRLASLIVDGIAIGNRASVTLSNVRAKHSVSAVFEQIPSTIVSQAGYGGSIEPGGSIVVPHGGDQQFSIKPLTGFRLSKLVVDGKVAENLANYSFKNVIAAHTIAATFVSVGPLTGSIPQSEKILFSCLADALPDSGRVSSWSSATPKALSLAAIGSPVVASIDGRKFVHNLNADGDGFLVGDYAEPIALQGASIVVAIKPERNELPGPWSSIVDAFYNCLVLGIHNDTGELCIWRNGVQNNTGVMIPNGQTSILSLIVQASGTYKVYANGREVVAFGTTNPFQQLTPGVQPYMHSVSIGRNKPDAWSTFNGYIGDTFFYKTALSDEDRKALENFIAGRLTGDSDK